MADDDIDHDYAAAVGVEGPVERVEEFAGLRELVDRDAGFGAVSMEVEGDDPLVRAASRRTVWCWFQVQGPSCSRISEAGMWL
ncbi:hypothetical protein ACF08M_16485 [Streptomyces sp. NPDC015032]|uniref:hypothetical protein n=1 Tax=Streptomyces sp. NPDC015032 TaxID=3364937 RepID=UPI0036FF9F51